MKLMRSALWLVISPPALVFALLFLWAFVELDAERQAEASH